MTDRQKCATCGHAAGDHHREGSRYGTESRCYACAWSASAHAFTLVPTPDTPTDRTPTREQELILDLFTQACSNGNDNRTFKYSHDCISAYEEAQEYLIEKGLIKASECAYK